MNTTIVITGATRGIGRGLAESFLKSGCRVVICGRSESTVRAAVEELAGMFEPARIAGSAADVAEYDDLVRLWELAVERYGRVDIWINNAGLGAPSAPFHERTPDEIQTLIHSNVIGVMNGSRVAMLGMLAQGGGAIYNMEGLGSRGPDVPGTALYAASKAAVTRFTRILVKDAAGGSVIVGTLSPGMVITELFTGPDEATMTTAAKRVANILADRVETVAPFLAQRVLSNRQHGAHIDWLTGAKIGWRFATAAFRRNRHFRVD